MEANYIVRKYLYHFAQNVVNLGAKHKGNPAQRTPAYELLGQAGLNIKA